MKNLRKNKKGFTLVEVIVVLVILAILIALAVPSVMKYIDDANEAKYLAEARAAYVAVEREIAVDYSDDKNFTINEEMLTEVKKDCGFKVTEVVINPTDAKEPNDIKSYTITFESPSSNNSVQKVEITKNGNAKLIKD